jgi:succinate dehydrogenase/fumarate reductase flavoprotein subunit
MLEYDILIVGAGGAGLYAALWASQNPNLKVAVMSKVCLLYTSPSPRDRQKSRMPSSA